MIGDGDGADAGLLRLREQVFHIIISIIAEIGMNVQIDR